MEKVTNILSRKHHFNTVLPTCCVDDALHQMHCENVDHLIVLDGNAFLGILSEHDITSKGIFANKPLTLVYVKEIMNTALPMATIDDSVERCMRLMRQFNVRYMPVFEDRTFKGVISVDDILQEALSYREAIFDVLNEDVPNAYA